MDLGVDELDYEEDGISNNPLNIKNDVINNKTDLPGVNDSYLQLDCSEEDEWLVYTEQSLEGKAEEGGDVGFDEMPSKIVRAVAVDSLNTDKRPPETGVPKIGAVENQEIQSEEKRFNLNKKPRLSETEEKEEEEDDGERTDKRIGIKQGLANELAQQQQHPDAKKTFQKTEAKKRVWTQRPGFRRRSKKSFNEPWLPGFGFSKGFGPIQPSLVALANSDFFFLQRHLPLPGTTPLNLPTRHPPQTKKIIPPLMAFNHRPVNQNPARLVPFTSRESNQTWRSKQETQSDSIGSFSSGDAMGKHTGVRFPSFQNVQPKEGKQEVQMRDNHLIKLNCLQEDEAELLKLRKEARLKRFMNNSDVRKEGKPLESNTEVTPKGIQVSMGCVGSVATDSSEAEEGKFSQCGDQQKENKSFGGSCSDYLGILSIKKEVLLQKRNPFEMGDVGGKGTQEKEILSNERVKVEPVEGAESGGLGEGEVAGKEESVRRVSRGVEFEGGELFCVKSDAGSQVRFVRTISKSLDELGITKQRTEARNGGGEFSPSVRSSSFGEEELQQEVGCQCERECHLTGCIVKVLNIPPSATTNDVLWMCNSVGKVKELKLNLPKENSAVIRFADPTSAEKFFSLYHGQKLSEYFLNVIVV